jgi:hypothetical protein
LCQSTTKYKILLSPQVRESQKTFVVTVADAEADIYKLTQSLHQKKLMGEKMLEVVVGRQLQLVLLLKKEN